MCPLHRPRRGVGTSRSPFHPAATQRRRDLLPFQRRIHEIERLVYLDADTLVQQNFDELFDSPFNFAAVPDMYGTKGFAITFNTGVLALKPDSAVLENKQTFETADYPPGEADQSF